MAPMNSDRIAQKVVDRDDLLNELATTARRLRWRAHELRRLPAACADEDVWHQEQAYIVARALEAAALQLEQVRRLPSPEVSPSDGGS